MLTAHVPLVGATLLGPIRPGSHCRLGVLREDCLYSRCSEPTGVPGRTAGKPGNDQTPAPRAHFMTTPTATGPVPRIVVKAVRERPADAICQVARSMSTRGLAQEASPCKHNHSMPGSPLPAKLTYSLRRVVRLSAVALGFRGVYRPSSGARVRARQPVYKTSLAWNGVRPSQPASFL